MPKVGAYQNMLNTIKLINNPHSTGTKHSGVRAVFVSARPVRHLPRQAQARETQAQENKLRNKKKKKTNEILYSLSRLVLSSSKYMRSERDRYIIIFCNKSILLFVL